MMRFIVFVLIVFSNSIYAAWGDSSNNLYGIQKYSFEDSVQHDTMLQCKDIAKAGGNKPEIFDVNIGNSREIVLNFETYSAKDVIIAEYEEKEVFNSGCIGTSGWKKVYVNTNGFTTKATIKVWPNCKGKQPSTRWKFYVDCN